MKIYTVSFFGHRKLDNYYNVEIQVECLVKKLLHEHLYVEFLVGREGDFDQIVASSVKRAQRTIRNDNSSLIWVMPYRLAEYENNANYYDAYYDSVEIGDISMSTYYKSAYQTRNRSMVDRSDLVVFWIEHTYGGAYQTMNYVKRKGGNYLNLHSMVTE